MSIILDGTTGITTPDVTSDGLTVDSTTLVVDEANNQVGIGTTSPNAKLDIVATTNTIRLGRSTSSYATIDSNSDAGSLSLNADAGNTAGGGSMTFKFAGSEKMRIDSAGNLLVGTTSTPNGTSVYGSAFVVEANDRRALYLSSSSTATGIGLARFYNPNGQVGVITTSGSSTAYVTSSDYRLKHDIQPMTGALAKVTALKPVTYKWNADNSEDEGFIAHELQEVCPSAVTGEKDAVDADGNPVYQGIDTSFLVATLTAAIQELKAINDAQAQTIESLTARVVALEGQP